MRSAAHLVARAALAAEDMAVIGAKVSEGDPCLPSITASLWRPRAQGLVEGRRTKDAVANASDETTSKSAASTKNVIDRLPRLPRRSS